MIYQSITDLAGPFLRRHLQRRVLRGKEDAIRVGERYGIAAHARPQGKLIWFHAASVGESVALLSLINAIIARYRDIHVLITSGTITSAKILAQRLPPQAIHQYSPLDRRAWVNAFLDHWRPNAAIWTESEIWPNLLRGLAKRRVPVAMINGRLSTSSAKNWRLISITFRNLLQIFSIRLAQSEEDAKRFRKFGVNFYHVGNLKLAVEPAPIDAAVAADLKRAIGARPVWLAASTHPGEEEMVFAIHKQLAMKHPDLLTILVPRHPARGDEIAALAATNGLSFARRSAGQLPAAGDGLYLADTMGELAVFYAIAPIVFIGGSLNFDGHSPIEAAQQGAAIVYGPLMRNNASIAAALEAADAARRVADQSELVNVIETWLTDQEAAKLIGQRARALADQGKDVVNRIMAELQPLFTAAGI